MKKVFFLSLVLAMIMLCFLPGYAQETFDRHDSAIVDGINVSIFPAAGYAGFESFYFSNYQSNANFMDSSGYPEFYQGGNDSGVEFGLKFAFDFGKGKTQRSFNSNSVFKGSDVANLTSEEWVSAVGLVILGVIAVGAAFN